MQKGRNHTACILTIHDDFFPWCQSRAVNIGNKSEEDFDYTCTVHLGRYCCVTEINRQITAPCLPNNSRFQRPFMWYFGTPGSTNVFVDWTRIVLNFYITLVLSGCILSPLRQEKKKGSQEFINVLRIYSSHRQREREREREREGGREAGARQCSYRPVYHVSFTHPQPNTSTPFPYTDTNHSTDLTKKQQISPRPQLGTFCRCVPL